MIKAITPILFLFPIIGICQSKPDCSKIKAGTFYYYPKNSNERYVIITDGKIQKEINQVTGDSAIGEIEWTGNHTYTEKYISITPEMKGQEAFYKKHKFAYDVIAANENYYVFNGYIDKISGILVQSDTVWLQEKTHFPNNALFAWLPDTSVISKEHFSDTSHYALLYVYRPANFFMCLANFMAYLNDNAICLMQNKSGFVFKIFKEGQANLKGMFYKNEAPVLLDIKFGNRYFVKAVLPWGLNIPSTKLKPQLTIMDPSTGSAEFEEVRIK